MAINPKEKQGARYRRVSSEMYADDKFRELSPLRPSGQGLWIYLLTGPFSTLIPGVCVGGEAGMSEALGWGLPAFRRCFQEIADQRMATADWRSRVIFLPNGLRHNLPQSPSVVTGWRQAWAEVPSCDLKQEAARAIRDVLSAMGSPYRQAFEEFALRRSTDWQPPQPDTQPASQAVEQPAGQPASHQDQDQDQDLPPTPLTGGGARSVDPRRRHPLDERPVLESWSVEACDRFLEAYPQKQGRVAALRSWQALNPDRALAQVILAAVTDRVARGWARELRFVPWPGKFIDERRWQERWTPPAPPLPNSGSQVPGIEATSAYLAEHRKAARG